MCVRGALALLDTRVIFACVSFTIQWASHMQQELPRDMEISAMNHAVD